VVHPFHPWSGREFEFVQRRRSGDADLVFVRLPGGDVVSLPVTWTDAVPPDPFVVLAGGRVPFRTEDLLAAARLAARIRSGSAGLDGTVKGILS
jgi:Family of unknown function (DUF5372)